MGDETSFASILAGVKRMRDEYDDENVPPESAPPTNTQPKSVDKPAPAPAPPSALTPSEPVKPKLITRKLPTKPTSSLEATPEPGSSTTARQGYQSSTFKRGMAPALLEVLVSKSQKGNPLLSDLEMKLTSWAYDGEILCDYYISRTFQILFLSLKYHKIRPEYIWTRVKKLKRGISEEVNPTGPKDNTLRVLLCVVDIDSPEDVLRQINDFCVKQDLSLVVAWLYREAGNYVAMAKLIASAPHKAERNIIPPKTETYLDCITDLLTTVPLVNKTDVRTLLANCGSFKQIVEAACDPNVPFEEMQGIGPTKAARLNQWFSDPFVYNK